jgi:hypothetical protein
MSRKIEGGPSQPVAITHVVGSVFAALKGTYLPMSNDMAAPDVNEDARVTYAAVAGQSHCIAGVAWSYDTAEITAAWLEITRGGVAVFQHYITTGGPGYFNFPVPMKGDVGEAMVITLYAGGADVQGSLTVLGHWTE